MRVSTAFVLLLTTITLSRHAAAETAPASLFDPTRHMRVSEVKVGMKGYGLSVFKGTALEKFDVEVLSVLKNFNPKYDVVLIKCHGDYLEHTGSIAGMSGSPIFLMDDSGRSRMIGAFAYGWPLTKDPVAGVQPIEYMLGLPTVAPATLPSEKAAGAAGGPGARDSAEKSNPRARWSLDDATPLPGINRAPARYPFRSWRDITPNPRLSTGFESVSGMQPLATPLMVTGLSPKILEQFSPIFRAYGIEPLQAGGGSAPANLPETKIEPGSVLAVPLLVGDVEMTAVGTCTEVLGDRVYGFGHAFNNEGPIAMPMGSGQIHAVIANIATSFKLGSLAQTRGTLLTDQTVGVAGRVGKEAPMVPIELRIVYADGSLDQSFSFRSALHSRFTPLISAAAMAAALGGVKDLPQYHTLEYDLSLEFINGRTIHIRNTGVNAGAADLFFEVGTPMVAAADNPFERVMMKKLVGKITVTPEAREAQILSVNVPRLKFRPGEMVKAYAVYRPFRAGEAILPITFDLPRDLPEGQYQLVVSDWERYVQDERAARPFRFVAENVDEVFAVLTDFTSIRHNALYLRLLRQPDGVAIGRAAMPHLPSSRRQVMLGSGRSNTTAFVSSTVKIVPTDHVMSGSADFQITIDKDAKIEIGGPKREPAAPAAPKNETPKSTESPKPSAAAPPEKAPEK